VCSNQPQECLPTGIGGSRLPNSDGVAPPRSKSGFSRAAIIAASKTSPDLLLLRIQGLRRGSANAVSRKPRGRAR
jgi:hypothetical protein